MADSCETDGGNILLKIVTDVSEIDYNGFIDRFFEEVKKHPEELGGAKIPGFARGLLKKIPDDKKIEMISGVVERHQKEAIPPVEQALSTVIGPVKLKSLAILHDKRSLCPVKIVMEILQMDADYIFTNVMPHFYLPENGPRLFGGKYGGPYDGPYDMASVQQRVRMLDARSKEYLVAKGMSEHKQAIMAIIGRALSSVGLVTKTEDMHFYFK